MRACLLLLFVTLGAFGDDSEDRRSKLPFIADAVGNALPPPHNGPATVGSPVNLLTPDRYEFYTFDESGELVKRLMTLEEIQAIVAAGEETEGLVTFANDNQPTIAFNFSQPPYTKVHNVVTNVQNVLKAQMEAHKNKPPSKPTLDTPDVSDSWSLILPSIFGNTGVDIVPDKTSGSFNTPETETIELGSQIYNDDSLHKEGSTVINRIKNTVEESQKNVPETRPDAISTTEKLKTSLTKTTTPKSLPKTTPKATTTTQKPRSTSSTTLASTTKASHATTSKPKTTPSTKSTNKPNTTTKLQLTTTSKPRTSSTTSKPRITTNLTPTTKQNVKATPISTTTKPYVSKVKQNSTRIKDQFSNPTTAKPTVASAKPNPLTSKLKLTTAKPVSTTENILSTSSIGATLSDEQNFTKIHTVSNDIPTSQTTDKTSIHYEKISTYVPISTAAYVTEKSTLKTKATSRPVVYTSSTKRSTYNSVRPNRPSSTSKIQPTTYKPTTYKPSTAVHISLTSIPDENEELNSTTVTTQSVSPSTTMAPTEFVSIGTNSHITKNKHSTTTEKVNVVKNNSQNVPLFDISESFSQIASDLGNYQSVTTSGDLFDASKINDIGMESKENEMDIPPDVDNNPVEPSNITDPEYEKYIEISTVTPPTQAVPEAAKSEISTNAPVSSTIDPILSGSMDYLLSQIVNQSPQNIIGIDKPIDEESKSTNEAQLNITKNVISAEVRTEQSTEKQNSFTTNKPNLPSEENDDIKTTQKIQSNKEMSENIKIDKPNNIANENNLQNLLLGVNQFNDMVAKKPDLAENKTENKTENTTENKTQNKTENTTENTTENKTENKPALNQVFNDVDDLKTEPKINDQSHITIDNKVKPEKNPANSSVQKDEVVVHQELVKIDKAPLNIPNKLENTLSSSDMSQNKLVTLDKGNISEKHSKPETKAEEIKKKIQKVNIEDKESTNDKNNSWKLVSTVTPPNTNETSKATLQTENKDQGNNKDILLNYSTENQGLEVTIKNLAQDVLEFTELCNELAFRYWQTMIQTIDKKRSFVLSPYSITSMLAMIFMGARGSTSGEMNEILKLDDMVTFNPHFVLKNISDSIDISPHSGVIVSAFIRELFSNRDKGKVHTFYKERANHFYNGHVEEVNFKLISDIIRRRTNLLVKRYTWGRITEYMKSNTITMQPPLAAFSANIFQTDCSGSSIEGRDGEMYFVVSPNVRLRRLVPVPAVLYRTGFLAGYDPVLDATAAALGSTSSIVSTLFLMPGQQGNVVHTDDLEQLEQRLIESNPSNPAWNRLLRTLLPRIGLELQIPRFLHKSLFNVSSTLRGMGLKDLFNEDHADLGGIIGHTKDLHVSDMIQSTTFVTCGEGVISEQHHMEEYPEVLGGPQRRRTSRWATGWEEPRDYQRAFHDPHDVGEALHLPLHLRPRQARLPARNAQSARLKFDRPFLYFVRHNPTGMILYVGRYNPRLLP